VKSWQLQPNRRDDAFHFSVTFGYGQAVLREAALGSFVAVFSFVSKNIL